MATIQLLSGFFFFLFFLGSADCLAQRLGDLARQERERRAIQSRRPRVYTNEDLARPRILDTEDRQAPESTPQSANVAPTAPPAEPPTLRSPIIEWPKDIPLGDVARFYRTERRKETAGTPELATTAPSTVDVDIQPWLFPNPLASPLPTTLDSFFPPREGSEPKWHAPRAAGETVRVKRGDTLWKIAERLLGSGNQWPKIAAANPSLPNPNHIRAGQRLVVPATEVAPQPVAPAGTQIQVSAGDSLWKLAAAQLGRGQAWACLAAANPQIGDAHRIYPGQVLVVPAACSTGR